VRTVRTTSGATAVQVVWSSRRGSRRIEHLGSAHGDDELVVLKQVAAERIAAGRSSSTSAWAPRPGRVRWRSSARGRGIRGIRCVVPTTRSGSIMRPAGTRCPKSSQRRSRQVGPRPVAVLGPPLPHSRIRPPRSTHHSHPGRIKATLDHGLSNALIESVNTQGPADHPRRVRVRSPDALIALAMLSRSEPQASTTRTDQPTDRSVEPENGRDQSSPAS
jgi:hypothetical protein